MYWSTHSKPVPLSEIGWINTSYLSSYTPRCDPMLVWGTTVDMEALEPFLASQRRQSGMIVSTAHVLIRAVSESLCKHPEVNRRVIGKKVYQYDGVNVVMPMLQTSSGEVDSIFLHGVQEMSLDQIARQVWDEARQRAQQVAEERRRKKEGTSFKSVCAAIAKWAHLQWVYRMSNIGFLSANQFRFPTIWNWERELYGANAFVNYLGSPGAPPLIAHKPAALPMNSYSVYVTLGPTEPRAVVVDNKVVVRKQASLFVRLDHRMVNGHQAGNFVSTLRGYLADPQSLIQEKECVTMRAA